MKLHSIGRNTLPVVRQHTPAALNCFWLQIDMDKLHDLFKAHLFLELTSVGRANMKYGVVQNYRSCLEQLPVEYCTPGQLLQTAEYPRQNEQQEIMQNVYYFRLFILAHMELLVGILFAGACSCCCACCAGYCCGCCACACCSRLLC